MEEKLELIKIHKEAIKKVRQEIKNILDTSELAPRIKALMTRRHVMEETLEEVGKYFGVTRERVRQMEAKALAILKQK